MKRSIILVIIGLIAGLGIGLYLGWYVWPVEFYDTDFASLHPQYKFELAVMVGAAYEQDGNWERAASRLQSMGEPDTAGYIRDMIHQAIANGQDPTKIRHLVSLADPLGIRTDIMEPFTRK